VAQPGQGDIVPFNRPTYTEIIDRTKTDIESKLDTGTLLRHFLLGYLAEGYSGAAHGLHGHGIDAGHKPCY
jgi:uncharacterized phage protein gp47/JayE